MSKKEMKNTTSYVNEHLLNIITPSGIDFSDNYASIGDGEGKIYCISKYPSTVDYGWLAELLNLPGTAAVMEYRYSGPDRMITAYNKKISELRSQEKTEKQESERQIIKANIQSLEELIKEISVQKMPVGYFNILLHVQAARATLLDDRIRKITGIVRTNECDIRHLKFRQKEAAMAMAPWGIPNPMVSNIGENNMPMSTFVGGFPMAAAGINDDEGWYFGKSRDRTVILNLWLRGKDRTNSNIFIEGPPGSGKSTAIKYIQIMEHAINRTLQVTWDAEQEYLDLAKHPWMQGEIVDCATTRINPLQIRYTPRITEEDLTEGEDISEYMVYEKQENDGFSDMALHIQNLRQLFAIYFGEENFKDPGVRKAFEKALIKTYNRKNITWDTDISQLQNEDFPIVKDFYDVVKEFIGDESLSARERDKFELLEEMLYSASEGTDSFFWNGYTTLNPKSEYIVLNVSKLLDMEDKMKNAQFFNLKMWEWQFLSQDRTRKAMSWMDEGYLFADPEHPQLIKLVRNTSKRGRKYEVGLGFITHSLVDVLDPAVKRHTQAIIDNSCYKLLMGADGKNLQENIELFKLTEKEITLLESKTRGKGILFAGNVRLELQVDVPDELMEMMGTAGGR